MKVANGSTRQRAIGSGAVRGLGPATARQRTGHARDARFPEIVLSVDDVHAEVRAIGEVVPLGSWIDPRDVSAGDRVSWHGDHADETYGGFHVVLVMVVVQTIAIVPIPSISILVSTDGER